MRWTCLPLCLAMLSGGCAHIGPVEAAVLMTTIAVGTSVARRADGECFTWCPSGTKCNQRSGLCEPLPCNDACKSGEHCDDSRVIARCVPDTPEDLQLRTSPVAGPRRYQFEPMGAPDELPPSPQTPDH